MGNYMNFGGEVSIPQSLDVRNFGVFRNEVKINNSHALRTLLHLSRAFTLTLTWSEVGIHAFQIEHLKTKNSKSLRAKGGDYWNSRNHVRLRI